MRKHCIPGSFFSAHAQEPGNEAKVLSVVSPVTAAFSLLFREDGPHRPLFIERLVEDRTEFGTSYYEFLTHINRQLSK